MFTGIVEEVGKVQKLGYDTLTVSCQKVLKGTGKGDSIAVNGACLTVTSIDSTTFSVEVMPETLRRTTIGKLHSTDPVNLERALSPGGRFGGHFVQGHIDDIGRVVSVKPEEKALIVQISAPAQVMRYVALKGFIAVDGVSLTVIDSDAGSFSVSLVSYTRQLTNLDRVKPGRFVNLEVDIIAKYVEKMMQGTKENTIKDFLEESDVLTAR
jgi:riboflavin synthase